MLFILHFLQVESYSNKLKDLENDLCIMGEIAKETRLALNFTQVYLYFGFLNYVLFFTLQNLKQNFLNYGCEICFNITFPVLKNCNILTMSIVLNTLCFMCLNFFKDYNYVCFMLEVIPNYFVLQLFYFIINVYNSLIYMMPKRGLICNFGAANSSICHITSKQQLKHLTKHACGMLKRYMKTDINLSVFLISGYPFVNSLFIDTISLVIETIIYIYPI